jgi:hypothetical protein
MTRTTLASITSLLLTAPALAQSPRMGGPMKHIMVGFDGSSLHAMVDPAVAKPLMQNYGETYAGGAAVLNGTMYNAQYGWMIEGLWQAPEGSSLWIEQIDATTGLLAYRGGTMMNPGSFTPIFSTSGSSPRINWSGTMMHNWYATQRTGDHAATYRVYFGDAAGVPVAGFGAGEVTLTWTAVAPACPADFNRDAAVTVQDIFDFLAGFFAGDMRADFNGSGTLSVQDIFDFLAAFFAGCA